MARAANKGHGRTGIRAPVRTAALNDSLDWPDVGQVFESERVRVRKGKAAVEVVCGRTSLARPRSGASALLGRARGPGGIENGLHHVRAEPLGEGRCRVRKGNGAHVLAALRNAGVHVLEGAQAPRKAAAARRLAAHPEEALLLLLE